MLLEQITIRNLLSFRDATVDLGPLNILIGENTAGKSNLIEVIGLLQAAPVDLRAAVLKGGGVRFWLWLGADSASPVATLACRVRYDKSPSDVALYSMDLAEDAFGMVVLSERISGSSGQDLLSRVNQNVSAGTQMGLAIDRATSVFSALKSPFDPTPTTRLGRQFERIRIYREFQTGPRSGSRQGVATSAQGDFLSETGDNLAMVLQDLQFHGILDRVRSYLARFGERIGDVRVRLDQGIARAYIQESGLLEPLPSDSWSDGTLKFLCLLAVLLHPEPPPLVCIEEPEQGLHPEAIRILADALQEASKRTQLIVTTHSPALVDAFSTAPECVQVCERDFDGGTQCRRLSPEKLSGWLERYSLGELWQKGEIGGNRW